MFFNSSAYEYRPVYAILSDDKTAAWSMVIEKAWAKVTGNYLKVDLGYTRTAMRAFPGVPTFSYSTTTDFNSVTAYALLKAADWSYYIMTADT